jgi:hypothetical protein
MRPQKLSDDQKWKRVQLAISLQGELETAQRRNWMEFYISDGSWASWEKCPTGAWLSLGEEIPERVPQTIEAEN